MCVCVCVCVRVYVCVCACVCVRVCYKGGKRMKGKEMKIMLIISFIISISTTHLALLCSLRLHGFCVFFLLKADGDLRIVEGDEERLAGEK